MNFPVLPSCRILTRHILHTHTHTPGGATVHCQSVWVCVYVCVRRLGLTTRAAGPPGTRSSGCQGENTLQEEEPLWVSFLYQVEVLGPSHVIESACELTLQEVLVVDPLHAAGVHPQPSDFDLLQWTSTVSLLSWELPGLWTHFDF